MSPAQIKKALAHLTRDKKLAALIKKFEKPEFERNRDPFESLCRAVVGQQLSVKAAATIYGRFKALYPRGVTPRAVAKTKPQALRKVGLSNQKASYVHDLAKKFLDGTVNPKNFHEMTDEAIREHLIAVKGVGRWTADMFLMFTLHRPNVLPTGDLGIQKSMQLLFKLRILPTHEKMVSLAEPWHPYRTIACHYLWDSLDNK
ncbi:MAG: DNA-3-methyladenine glycosylase [Patescibacteria group bacterium]